MKSISQRPFWIDTRFWFVCGLTVCVGLANPGPGSPSNQGGGLQRQASVFKVSNAMALQSVAETFSWRRTAHVLRHAEQLRSPEALERAKAAWFLSQIQGSDAYSALLRSAANETNLLVLREIVTGVASGLFRDIYEPAPTLETVADCQEYVSKIRESRASFGHDRMIRQSFTKISSLGSTASKTFLEAASERFEPEVWRILCELSFDSKDPTIAARARDLLLVATGFDTTSTTRSQVLSDLNTPQLLEGQRIISRLSRFAESKGFESISTNPTATATWLFRAADPLRRGVAFRLLL